MHILVLGYSNIYKRKIEPILSNSSYISLIDYASISKSSEIEKKGKVGTIYNSYDEALIKSQATIVYITTTNNLHEALTIKSIKNKKHVLLDKPTLLSTQFFNEHRNFILNSNLCLSEVNVWSYHSQIAVLKTILKEKEASLKHIRSTFCFPPFQAANFRNYNKFGGGAINDLLPYFVSTANEFFEETEIYNHQLNVIESNSEIDISICTSISYKSGKSIVGFYSFNSQYTNRIELLSDKANLTIDRAYTTPENLENTVYINSNNKKEEHKVSADNTFLNYFSSVLNDIQRQKFNHHFQKLENNSRVFNALIA